MKRWTEITSLRNDLYRLFLGLAQSPNKDSSLCLVSGRKTVPELIERYPNRIRNLIVNKSWLDSSQYPLSAWTQKLSHAEEFSPIALSGECFKGLDILGTKFPLLMFSLEPIKTWELAPENPNEVLLGFTNPANLGAAIRSSIAFGINRFVLLKETPSPFHPKSIRASAGAVFHAEFFLGPSILEIEPSARIVALDINGSSSKIQDFSWPKPVSVLVGEEGRGIPKKDFDFVHIPISHEIESLNATVALAIALFDWAKKV